MSEPRNIQPLLQEVGVTYQNLVNENKDLKEKIADLETDLQALNDNHNQVTQALTHTQEKLDRFHPDMQTLRDQLEQAEVEINTLSMDVSKKNGMIEELEQRIQEMHKSRQEPQAPERVLR